MALPSISRRVPTIAGKIPPAVMPSEGALERKSQLITPAPLYMMKPSMAKSIRTIRRLRTLKTMKATFCDLRFFMLKSLG